MSGADLWTLAPLAVPALAATIVMLLGGFRADRRLYHGLAVGALAIALLAILMTQGNPPRTVSALLIFDGYAHFFLAIIYSATGLLAIFARPYLAVRERDTDAFYALLLFAATGMGVLACSNHFAALFLGLETLTVSLYTLIGYLRDEARSLEAAAKYLVLAALSSSFLLFGIALVFAATGTLLLTPAFRAIVDLAPQLGRQAEAAWALAGGIFLFVGFAFKLALVPFHMWSPDVYQGAPAPVTALIATGSKGAVLAVLLRAVGPVGLADMGGTAGLTTLAVLTMFGGNLLALVQDDIKRLLAYSSIAHLGYVMVALLAGGVRGAEAVAFYVLAYVLTTLGAFGVVTIMSSDSPHEADNLAVYRGIGWRRPWLAATLTVMILSLAGVPPTAGFLAKVAVLGAAIGADRTGLALAMAIASGVAIFFYLRVIVVMYMQEGEGEQAAAGRPLSVANTVTLVVLAALVIAVGLYPTPWFDAVRAAVGTVLPT
jgi:NADH-quinone oxidoreductase subunit N